VVAGYLLFCPFHSRDGGMTDRTRESYRELEQERARLLSENAVLEEEVKELQQYIDSHLGRSVVNCCSILAEMGLNGLYMLKLLGLMLYANLTFNQHAQLVSRSYFYHIRALHQICYLLDQNRAWHLC